MTLTLSRIKDDGCESGSTIYDMYQVVESIMVQHGRDRDIQVVPRLRPAKLPISSLDILTLSLSPLSVSSCIRSSAQLDQSPLTAYHRDGLTILLLLASSFHLLALHHVLPQDGRHILGVRDLRDCFWARGQQRAVHGEGRARLMAS